MNDLIAVLTGIAVAVVAAWLVVRFLKMKGIEP